MKPSEKLKEIEDTIYFDNLSAEEKETLVWLINRVKRLTEALEKISHDKIEINPWTIVDTQASGIARKALESEE